MVPKLILKFYPKLYATGFKIKEVPASFRRKKTWTIQIKFKSKTISHVLFSLYEKPMILIWNYRTILLL